MDKDLLPIQLIRRSPVFIWSSQFAGFSDDAKTPQLAVEVLTRFRRGKVLDEVTLQILSAIADLSAGFFEHASGRILCQQTFERASLEVRWDRDIGCCSGAVLLQRRPLGGLVSSLPKKWRTVAAGWL